MNCIECGVELVAVRSVKAGRCAICRKLFSVQKKRIKRKRDPKIKDVSVMWKPGVTLEEMVKNVALSCLDAFDGNRTRTASALGVSVRALRNWLTEWKVPPRSEFN